MYMVSLILKQKVCKEQCVPVKKVNIEREGRGFISNLLTYVIICDNIRMRMVNIMDMNEEILEQRY